MIARLWVCPSRLASRRRFRTFQVVPKDVPGCLSQTGRGACPALRCGPRTSGSAEGEVRRRAFVGLLGGAAAWAVAARSQQAMPVIGYVNSGTSATNTHTVAAFRQSLKEAGFVEGQNVAIEFRWAEDQYDRLPALAADLIQRPVAVIVANTLSALRAKAATTTVPIVFTTGSDPVRDGLVASLNQPGGNVTGVVFIAGALGAKRLELLRQLVPNAATTAMLVHPNTPESEAERSDVQAAAQAIG